jgi:hypothetical protein
MIGVFVNDEVIAAIPAPIRGERPIPGGDIKIESAGKPEPVMVWVKPGDSVSVCWPEMRKVAMFEWAIQVEPCVVRRIMAVEVITAYVRRVICVPGRHSVHLALLALIRAWSGRRRNPSPVRARWVG